jgi:YVTN family beta-propeller protein
VGVDARIGSSLREYRLESLLGRGGMGAVYLAWDGRLGRRVALKLLTPELATDDRFRERFLRESRLAASLDHPNVIPIYEAGEAEGQLYIAMRYVEGTDLDALLESEGRLAPERTLAILTQVAAALDAAHERELVHRDVKPGNVLRDTRGHVYLCDFGLTKQASSISGLTGTGQLVGTLDYLAPEQIRGDPVDGRADVYSLGCLLYQCLSGAPPFRSDNEAAVLWGHVHEEPPPLTNVRAELPKSLDRVLARALAKAPDDRYQTASALADATRAALADQLRPRPTIRLSRRSRLILAVALVAFAAAIAATATVLLRDGPGEVVIEANSVAVIDPTTNKVVADIPVGIDPTSIAVGEGAVWVANESERTISRIDPTTRKVVRIIPIGDLPFPLIAAGEGAVWATSSTGTLARIDPVFNQITRTVKIGNTHKPAVVGQKPAYPVAVGAGAVWVADPVGFVYRIDPATLRPVARMDVRMPPAALAVGATGVWLAEAPTNQVRRVNLTLSLIRGTFTVGGEPTAIALGNDAVWVAGRGDDVVTRIDAGRAAARTIDVGDAPTGVAVGAGSVWVANERGANVMRIDARTSRVVATTSLHAVPKAIAVTDGVVWVTAQSVTR